MGKVRNMLRRGLVSRVVEIGVVLGISGERRILKMVNRHLVKRGLLLREVGSWVESKRVLRGH